MAICQIAHNRNMTPEQADQIFAHLRATGPVPPDGARLLISGPADAGYRIITVWDSNEAREQFLEGRLAQAYGATGLSMEDLEKTVFEVRTLVAGDLVGTPQPA
jgi:hypothetical protein